MSDALIGIGKQFGTGLALFYSVVKFFDTVGDRLNEETRLRVSAWLMDAHPSRWLEAWPITFGRLFDRVFGQRHLSWKCFWRSCVASYSIVAIEIVIWSILYARGSRLMVLAQWLPCSIIGNALPDYVSLLETRLMLRIMARVNSNLARMLCIAVDLGVTALIAALATVSAFLLGISVNQFVTAPHLWTLQPLGQALIELPLISPLILLDTFGQFLRDPAYRIFLLLWFFPAFFTSIWLWLYAGSGFLLKVARGLDASFTWLRHLDIAKRPLQSIGLVSGIIAALVYWIAVVVVSLV